MEWFNLLGVFLAAFSGWTIVGQLAISAMARVWSTAHGYTMLLVIVLFAAGLTLAFV